MCKIVDVYEFFSRDLVSNQQTLCPFSQLVIYPFGSIVNLIKGVISSSSPLDSVPSTSILASDLDGDFEICMSSVELEASLEKVCLIQG